MAYNLLWRKVPTVPTNSLCISPKHLGGPGEPWKPGTTFAEMTWQRRGSGPGPSQGMDLEMFGPINCGEANYGGQSWEMDRNLKGMSYVGI